MKLSEIRAAIDATIERFGDLEAVESHTFGDPTPIAGLYTNHAIFDRDGEGRIEWDKVAIGFRRQPVEPATSATC